MGENMARFWGGRESGVLFGNDLGLFGLKEISPRLWHFVLQYSGVCLTFPPTRPSCGGLAVLYSRLLLLLTLLDDAVDSAANSVGHCVV